MSRWPVTHRTQDVLDYLEGNFAIPEDGFESDIEGFESESDNDLEPEIIPPEDLMEPDDEIDLRNAVMEDEEAEDTENRETSAAGRPSNYSFEGLEWTDAPEEVPAIPEFRENVGPAVACSADMSPLDYFLLFVDNHMLTSIVRETNRFAVQCLTANGKDPNSWAAVTLEELKAFLGLIIAMSIHSLPSMRDYWKDDWVLGVPEFAKVMPRNRFLDINRYLHLNDNSKIPACESPDMEKLFKLRPFLESLQAKFTHCYNPHKEQAIDEAMIKYKGRTSLKQYMPMKPIKRGIKVWCRADSHSGYLCDFDIYTGRHRDGVERGLGYSVVTRLCRGIEGKWYNVYFDNFFTSYPLLEDLYSKKILSCGTVRQGRKEFPAVLFDKNATKTMKRGETVWRMKGPILALTWIDNKPVTISGTITGIPDEQLPEVQRRKKDGTLENVACPPIVSAYNCYMGGVDKNDQMKSYYGINISGKKWWTRVFFDLIDRAIFNGKVLFNESPHTPRKSLKDFKVNIAKLLIGNFCSRRKRGRSSLDNQQARFVERHFPDFLPMNENGRRMERRCFICSGNNIRKKQATIALTVMLDYVLHLVFTCIINLEVIN